MALQVKLDNAIQPVARVVLTPGKVVKRYRHQDVWTPLERLTQLSEAGLVRFKVGTALQDLQALSALFAQFNRPKVQGRA